MRFLLLILALVSLSVLGLAKDATAPKTAKLFAWYDRLGFEDLSKAKFARIWTGQWTEVGDDNRLEQDIILGFVLEDDGKTFRAVLGDLTGCLLKKHGNDPSNRAFCGYQEISLQEEAKRLLKALKDPQHVRRESEQEAGTHYAYFNRLPSPGRVFVIARECARRDLKDLGSRLATALTHYPKDDAFDGFPFPEWLENQLSYVMLWRGRIASRDPSCSWTDLRAKFQRILDECPRSHWKDSAEKHANEITALLASEKARQRLAPGEPEELVWKLHEEVDERIAAYAGIWDYWPRPYPFRPRQSVGVIAALRAKGFAAVPALLAELQRPPRPSRSASRFIRMGGSVDVANTHALALSILEDIAGFSFHSLTFENSKNAEIGIAEDWWLAVQQGRERAWLRRHAQAGEGQARAVEAALMARHSADAFEAASGAIRLVARDPSLRQKSLDRLLALNDPRAAPFLLKEITDAQTLEAEISFAYALRRVGSPEAERRILESFREFTEEDFESAANALVSTESDQAESGPLMALQFLTSSQSEDIWRAMMEKWPVMPSAIRAMVGAQLGLRLSRDAL